MNEIAKPTPVDQIISACASCPSRRTFLKVSGGLLTLAAAGALTGCGGDEGGSLDTLSSDLTGTYTHLRAHETEADLV